MFFHIILLFSLLFPCCPNPYCSENLVSTLKNNSNCFLSQEFGGSLYKERELRVINSDIYQELVYHRQEGERSNKRVLFVSYIDNKSFGNPRHYSRYSFTLNKAFCQRHGFDYLVLTNKSTPSESDPRWEKVNIMYFLLKKSMISSDYNLDYHYFVWFDADLLFLPSSYSSLPDQEDIVHRIISSHPNSSVLISSEYHAETGIANTGCFIVKNTVFSLLFFRTWLNDMNHSEGHDQILFGKLYNILVRNPNESSVKLNLSSTLVKFFQSLQNTISMPSYLSITPFLSFPITSLSVVGLQSLLSETAHINKTTLVIRDDNRGSLSHIVVLPANYLNSFPPVYYSFNENSTSENYVLHLMGESNEYRYKVFQGIYDNVCFDYLNLGNCSTSTISKYLGVTRSYLQTVLYEVSMNTLIVNWRHLLSAFNIVKVDDGGNQAGSDSLMDSFTPDYLSSISEIRQILILLKNFPLLELEQLFAKQLSFITQPLSTVNFYQSWSEFRLLVYYSIFNDLNEFSGFFLRNVSLNDNHLLLELINLRTLIGNDLLTEFNGNEGYGIKSVHDNLFITYYLFSSSSRFSSKEKVFLHLESPEFSQFAYLSSLLPLSFSYDMKMQLISQVEDLFSLLFRMVHPSAYLVVLGMKCVFLHNKSQFYYRLVVSSDSSGSSSSDYCTPSIDSIKESIVIYEENFFGELSSLSIHNNHSHFGAVLLSDSQKFPLQMYEMISSYSTLASLLCYCGDTKQSNSASTATSSLTAFWYYDYAISLLEILLGVKVPKENSKATSLSLFTIQEHHFSLIRLYYERIYCSLKQAGVQIQDTLYYQHLRSFLEDMQQKKSIDALSDIELTFEYELESFIQRLSPVMKQDLHVKSKRFRRKSKTYNVL
jgi:hypothetical protein